MARLFCVVLLLANGINCYCYLLDLPSKTFLTINMKKMFFHITAHLWCTRKSFRSLWCSSIAPLQSFEMIFFFMFFLLDLLFWMFSFALHLICLLWKNLITSISLICYLGWILFQSTQSVYFTPFPPNRSKALEQNYFIMN